MNNKKNEDRRLLPVIRTVGSETIACYAVKPSPKQEMPRGLKAYFTQAKSK